MRFVIVNRRSAPSDNTELCKEWFSDFSGVLIARKKKQLTTMDFPEGYHILHFVHFFDVPVPVTE
jgi:hypothetical protein